MESTAIVPLHHHTVECSASGRGVHQPTTYSKVTNIFRSIASYQYCLNNENHEIDTILTNVLRYSQVDTLYADPFIYAQCV